MTAKIATVVISGFAIHYLVYGADVIDSGWIGLTCGFGALLYQIIDWIWK